MGLVCSRGSAQYGLLALRRTFAWAAIGLGLATAAFPISAIAQDAPTEPISVVLDLYYGDKSSKDFSDYLTAAISGDERFQLVKTLPPNGMKIIMNDALIPSNDDSRSIAAYDVMLKFGNGKYIDEKQGFCDLSALRMCGLVVAQDSFDAYEAYVAKHKTK